MRALVSLTWQTVLLVTWHQQNRCAGQQPGTQTPNFNIPLQIEECSGSENCQPIQTKATLDHNWRWLHEAGGYTNCYSGNVFDSSFCPDPATCTQNCAIEGVSEADWLGTYGVHHDGSQVQLDFVTTGAYSTNIGSRLFLLNPSETEYYMFKLKNREFTLDVDVSELGCGLNGAVYLVEMDPDGGASKYPTNTAGAGFGTGYCDAQCPHDLKFINGEANVLDWKPSDVDANSGHGHYGSCCVELDIWEANSLATAFTLHPCDTSGAERCEGVSCGDNDSGDRYNGVCDKDGCDFHNWRMGDRNYFGPGSNFVLDTTKPMTVVTQFLTHDGTDNGDLVEMRRLYLQDGKLIDNSFSNIPGVDRTDSVNGKMCQQSKDAFGDVLDFQEKGGMKDFGDSMDGGLVLVLSLWDDFDAHMLWLDGDYPTDRDPSEPGVSRGPCDKNSGNPIDIQNSAPQSNVKFSKLRFGTLGSTYPGGTPPTTTTEGPNQTTTTQGPNPTTTSTTSKPGCPGGNLDHCIALCPSEPPDVHDGCVAECNTLCRNSQQQ